MEKGIIRNHIDLERFMCECNHYLNKKDEEESYKPTKTNKEEE